MTIPEPNPLLVEALKNNRAVAVVGSGLSLPCGAPTWKELLRKLVRDAQGLQPNSDAVREAEKELKRMQYLNCAGLLETALGAAQFRELVAKLFRDQELESTVSHHTLMQLGFRAVVTTNYDRILEAAAPKAQSLCWDDAHIPSLLRGSECFILKIHGDIQKPQTIVLTRDAYAKCCNFQPTRGALKALFTENSPFFIGYGHADQDLDVLFDTLRECLGLDGGFALSADPSGALKQRLEQAHIANIPLKAYSEVPEYLLCLAKKARRELQIPVSFFPAASSKKRLDSSNIAKKLSSGIERLLATKVLASEARKAAVVLTVSGVATLDLLRRVQAGETAMVSMLREHGVRKVDTITLKDSLGNRDVGGACEPQETHDPSDEETRKRVVSQIEGLLQTSTVARDCLKQVIGSGTQDGEIASRLCAQRDAELLKTCHRAFCLAKERRTGAAAKAGEGAMKLMKQVACCLLPGQFRDANLSEVRTTNSVVFLRLNAGREAIAEVAMARHDDRETRFKAEVRLDEFEKPQGLEALYGMNFAVRGFGDAEELKKSFLEHMTAALVPAALQSKDPSKRLATLRGEIERPVPPLWEPLPFYLVFGSRPEDEFLKWLGKAFPTLRVVVLNEAGSVRDEGAVIYHLGKMLYDLQHLGAEP